MAMLFSQRIGKKHLKQIEDYRKVIPVDVRRIAKELGVAVIDEEAESFTDEEAGLSRSGYIKQDGNLITIHVNKNQSEIKKRFTIAHEIAHFLLHSDTLKVRGTMDRNESPLGIHIDKKESEANALAADILMPLDKIRFLLDESVANGQSMTIEDLAERLQVPKQALKIKLNMG